MIIIHNDGPRIRDTNFWEIVKEKCCFSINESCLRVLVPIKHQNVAQEMVTGNMAVLSIGPCKDWGGINAAHLMFDDGSDSPYSLVTELGAFIDVQPSPADDERKDLTCAVYVSAPDLTPQVAGIMPLRIRHTLVPNYTETR